MTNNKTRPDNILTIYGRKPVLEALENTELELFRLHLAESNRPDGIIKQIKQLASERKIETRQHSKQELSRISKNGRQDQGVALDIMMPGFQSADQFIEKLSEPVQLIALDGITNSQNLGMIIRSICASPLTALLLPGKGCAKLDALVIKASAGTLFKCPIVHCHDLPQTLQKLSAQGVDICLLDSQAEQSLFDYQPGHSAVYVLGNETQGVSQAVANTATHHLKIPLHNNVESLNVAAAATLVAFR